MIQKYTKFGVILAHVQIYCNSRP